MDDVLSEPTWREVARPAASATTGLWLLAALNGWDIAPRWVMLTVGWMDFVAFSVIAIVTLVEKFAFWWERGR